MTSRVPGAARAHASGQPQRQVLVIRFGALGDVVLATSVIEALAHEVARPIVHLVTKRAYAPLFAHDERVSRIFAFDGNLLRLLRDLRRERYDRVIDLNDTWRSRLVARAARAGERRRVDKRGRERRALVRTRVRSPRLDGDVAAWYTETIGGAVREPRLAHEHYGTEAREMLDRLGVPDGFVAVCPGAGRRTKEWPRARIERFLREATRGGEPSAKTEQGAPAGASLPCLLVGGPEERRLVGALAAESGVPALVPALAVLPALLARASLVLTGDTGPLHVAEAVGTPVVALFGPTVPAFGFAPRDPRSTLIERDMVCRPCSVHGSAACPLGHHRCLDEITAEEVLRVVRALRENWTGVARRRAGEVVHGPT